MNVRRLYAEVESISWLTAVQPNLVLHFDVNRCWNMGLSRTSSHLEVFTRWPGGYYLLVRSRESFHLCSSGRWSCVSWLNSFMCGCLTGCWFQCGGVSAQLFLPPHWVCYCRMPLFLTVQTLLTALMGPKGPIVPLNQLERYLLLQYSHVCSNNLKIFQPDVMLHIWTCVEEWIIKWLRANCIQCHFLHIYIQ